MIINASQDTVETFSQINRLVSQEYRKHFDASYEDLPLPKREKDKKLLSVKKAVDLSDNFNLRASFLFSKI